MNLHFYKIYFHHQRHILMCHTPQNIFFMSGPWIVGRNIFWLKIFSETNKSLWGPSPRKKICYFPTIGGFLAIVPLYVDVFLRL